MTTHMKIFSMSALLACAVGLSSCGTLSKEECLAADWAVIGEQDGNAGYAPQERFAAHTKSCKVADVIPDQTRWNLGYQKGLLNYCTPQSGLRVGERGKTYANVCPAETAGGFLEGYRIGRKIHSINSAISNLQADIRRYQREIDENFSKISTLDPKDSAARLNIEFRSRELNRNIVRDRDSIDDLRRDLIPAEQERNAFLLRQQQIALDSI